MTKSSLASFFPDFRSSEIDSNELEDMIKDAVRKESPESGEVKEIKYTDDGVDVILENDGIIEIEIDWQEIIIK